MKSRRGLVLILALSLVLVALTACQTPGTEKPTPMPTKTPTPEPASFCPRPSEVELSQVTNPSNTFCLVLEPASTVESVKGGFTFKLNKEVPWYTTHERHVWIPKGWKLEGIEQTGWHEDKDHSRGPDLSTFGCGTTQNLPIYGPLSVAKDMWEGTLIYVPNETTCAPDTIYGRAEQVRQMGDCPTIFQVANTQRWNVLAQTRIDARVYSQYDTYLPKGWKAVPDNGIYGIIKEDQDGRTMRGGTGWMIYLPAACVASR